MSLVIPSLLAKHCAKVPEHRIWLATLPRTIETLRRRWSLSLSIPYEHEYVSCSWVAPAIVANGTPAVLKIGMPHMEGEQEIEGLRFWDGQATVRLLESDQTTNAMLLERCEPGTPLLSIAETEQDVIVTTILKRCSSTSLDQVHPADRDRVLPAATNRESGRVQRLDRNRGRYRERSCLSPRARLRGLGWRCATAILHRG
jgi:Aminoglycoside/hydroxyurea antibiotic resistance kinase